MKEAMLKACLKSLDELKAMMEEKMAEGDGDEEMEPEKLSEAVEKAAGESEPSEGMHETDADMKEDFKRMMQGAPPKQSRGGKMTAIAIKVKPMPFKKMKG